MAEKREKPHKHPTPEQLDERLVIEGLDPAAAIAAILKVDPDSESAEKQDKK